MCLSLQHQTFVDSTSHIWSTTKKDIREGFYCASQGIQKAGKAAVNILKNIHERLQREDLVTKVAIGVILACAIAFSQLYFVPLAVSIVILIIASAALYKYILEPTARKILELKQKHDIERARMQEIFDEFAKQDTEVAQGWQALIDPRYETDPTTPQEFICPITLMLIRQPIVLQEGTLGHRQAYELCALTAHYDTNPRHVTPLTRTPFSDPRRMSIDTNLRIRIAQYVLERSKLSAASNV